MHPAVCGHGKLALAIVAVALSELFNSETKKKGDREARSVINGSAGLTWTRRRSQLLCGIRSCMHGYDTLAFIGFRTHRPSGRWRPLFGRR